MILGYHPPTTSPLSCFNCPVLEYCSVLVLERNYILIICIAKTTYMYTDMHTHTHTHTQVYAHANTHTHTHTQVQQLPWSEPTVSREVSHRCLGHGFESDHRLFWIVTVGDYLARVATNLHINGQ